MRMRAVFLLGLALVLAGLTAFMARGWLQQQRAATTEHAIATVKVVVAKTPLHFGNVIRREHLRLVDWPATAVPEGTFSSFNEILSDKDERVALRPIEPSEPILKSKVSGFGGRATLSTQIADEMRATTIRVNDVNGVAGFVLPGDRVDVLLTRSKEQDDATTDVLLQNLKVLAIDQIANQSKDEPKVARSVTLEVTPEQAQKLTLAQQIGSLSLALRNVTNAAAERTKTISVNDLRVAEANNTDPNAEVKQTVNVVKAPTKRSPGPSVRVIRGTTVSKYEVTRERSGSGTAVSLEPAVEAETEPSSGD